MPQLLNIIEINSTLVTFDTLLDKGCIRGYQKVINSLNENKIESYIAIKKQKKNTLLIEEAIIMVGLIFNLCINIRNLQRRGIHIYNSYRKLLS